jgi:hypothetical protein
MNDDLIAKLSNDLDPVRRPWPPGATAAAWLLVSACYVLVVMAALGPFRSGFAEQLTSTPRFALEMALGVAAAVCFVGAAFRASVPGYDTRGMTRLAWVLTAGWLGHFALGFDYPVLEPSMEGKRDHCVYEAYLYSVPTVLAAIWLQRRRYPLKPLQAALHAALAAALIPAIAMQIACMYEPGHILAFHVLPVGVLAGCVVIAWLVMRWFSRA